MTETEKAYIAGLIDGEGSIVFTKHVRKYYVKKGCIKTYTRDVMTYDILVKLCMQSKEAVEFFASKVGGKVSLQKAGWHCAVWHKKAYNLLIAILPYLTTKKRRAEFAIWCHENIFSRKSRVNYMRSEQDVKVQELCYEISRLLNHEDSLTFNGKSDEFGESLNLLGKQLTSMVTPSQASLGLGSEEGVTTTQVSPNNNPEHERPTLFCKSDDIV